MKISFFTAIVLGICTTFFHYNKIHKDVILSFDMAIVSDLGTANSQIFYNTGDGYNEKESFRQPVLCDGKYHPLRYRLILKNGHYLRLDPLNGKGRIRIKNIEFSFFYENIIIPINYKKITQTNQIEAIEVDDQGILSLETTADASDPYLLIPSLNKKPYNIFSVRKYLILFFLKFSSIFLAMLLIISHITERK